jgi:hypothetical protein
MDSKGRKKENGEMSEKRGKERKAVMGVMDYR